jgi:cytochrome b561
MKADHQRFTVLQRLLHWAMAICILAMLFLRSGAPALPRDLPAPMRLAAALSHYALYGLMIGMPLLGLAMLASADYPIVLWGGIRLPQLLPQSDLVHTLAWNAHRYLAFAFFGLILVHLAAALFHALVRRDGVFYAMAPVPSRPEDAAVR